MTEAATWRMDPEHLDEAVKLLREYMDDDGASILIGVAGTWLPLLEVDQDEARTEEWVERVDGLCIEGTCTTTLASLDGVEPGPIRLRHDDGVDGPILYVGQRPVLAIAGAGLSTLPDGLLHLEAAEAPLAVLRSVAASSAGRRLVSLDVGGSDALSSLACPEFLEDLPNLRALDISGFEGLVSLEPVGQLSALTVLTLEGCTALRDLAPLAGLASLEHLDLSECEALEDLQPLASLTSLTTLDLSGCSRLASLTPLSDLPALRHLGLASCNHLPDLAPLVRVVSLSSLDLSDCDNLASVAILRACGRLDTLLLAGTSSVADARALTACTNLRTLTIDDASEAAIILAAAAVRRVDAAFVEAHIEAWLEVIGSATSSSQFVDAMLPALALGQPAPWAVDALARLIDGAHEVSVQEPSTWKALFSALLALGDPACRSGFERGLSNLAPGKEVQPFLGPALDALARVPDAALPWANGLADSTLDSLLTTPRAAAVATDAVRYYARTGRVGALDPWLEVLVQTRAPAGAAEPRPPKQDLPSHEDDPAALSGLVARLVQKQPDSPPVAQLVAALVGLARERPDCATIQPFVEHFVQLVQRSPDNPSVVRLSEALSRSVVEHPTGAPATRLIDLMLAELHRNPDQPWVARLAEALSTLATQRPDCNAVSTLTAARTAALDAGVEDFARRVLANAALRELADGDALAAHVQSFDGPEARRALIRGLVDALCDEDILRNKPKAGLIAVLDKDLVDIG